MGSYLLKEFLFSCVFLTEGVTDTSGYTGLNQLRNQRESMFLVFIRTA